jgi:hypothetical protein
VDGAGEVDGEPEPLGHPEQCEGVRARARSGSTFSDRGEVGVVLDDDADPERVGELFPHMVPRPSRQFVGEDEVVGSGFDRRLDADAERRDPLRVPARRGTGPVDREAEHLGGGPPAVLEPHVVGRDGEDGARDVDHRRTHDGGRDVDGDPEHTVGDDRVGRRCGPTSAGLFPVGDDEFRLFEPADHLRGRGFRQPRQAGELVLRQRAVLDEEGQCGAVVEHAQ